MKKEINIDLEYRDNGERGVFPLSIDFVSNWCIREYNKVLAVVYDVKNKWDEISDILSSVCALSVERPEGYKERIDDLEKRKSEITQQLMGYQSTDVLEIRFDIVKTILKDNGYKESFLFDYDFWDRSVDPAWIIDFLNQCIWKDIDKKKVV